MRKVYLDSCVLISAFRGDADVSDRALAEIDAVGIERLYSRIVELEVLSKPSFFGREHEVAFMKEVFSNSTRVPCSPTVIDEALSIGCSNGLGAGDALHVAYAAAGGASEIVTTEKPTKSFPNAPASPVRIRSISGDS